MNRSGQIKGTCMDMCPEQERKMRELQMRLHPLEMVLGTEDSRRPRSDPSATIKEYSRPAAGKADALTSDLRPPQVLLKTVHFMIKRILPRTDYRFVKLYDFVFDRLRSVRQDLVIQRVTGTECVQILEMAVRFHLYSGYSLCTEPVANYDGKINADHAQECLKRLLVMYRDADREGTVISNDREELEALYLLFNLGSTEALQHAVSLPKQVRQHPSVRLALRIHSANLQGNFLRVWRLASECSYIQSCALHRHLLEMRRRALQVLNAAYSSKNLCFPVGVLSRWLLFDTDEEGRVFCRSHGLRVDEDGVRFQKSSPLSTGSPSGPFKCSKLVDSKQRGVKVHDLIMGHTNRDHSVTRRGDEDGSSTQACR
ncbi:germinal-center associated nuclear protein-like isoform X2 [Acanthaster planci]|uniref:Germinal-center associated nuclear protein-like isoform X2 n=1 Tax=Acanthaster planci TaxID=133434 RepID=A0A8B7Y2S2_ACAPL|nr:germinal-center associated nuclear protein-like isoform X2 [Acanthaster planci]